MKKLEEEELNKYRHCRIFFDVIGTSISVLDTITDIIILITWYYEDRMVFFWISTTILILAQISYLIMFYDMHGNKDNTLHLMISILCSIPFLPFLPIIFYFVSDEHSYLRTLIDTYLICYSLDWDINDIDKDDSPQQQYAYHILYTHFGFVIQAIMEAFPQSLLQLIAIVYYNEPDTISIISILLSMMSVCFKLILITISDHLYGWKLRLFVWLCFVVDFVGIFYIVSFAFYTPTNMEYQSYFIFIRNTYFWQFMICILPFAGIGLFGFYIYWTISFIFDDTESVLSRIFQVCAITVLCSIASFVILLCMEISCVFWIAIGVTGMDTSARTSNKTESREFYELYMDWILNAKNAKDRILRLCVFNKVIMEQHPKYTKNEDATDWHNFYDKELLNYLQNEAKEQFENATLKGLRSHHDATEYVFKTELVNKGRRRHYSFWMAFWYEIYAPMFMTYYIEWKKMNHNNNRKDYCLNGFALAILIWLTLVSGPIYFVSRIFNVVSPIFIVIYLRVYGDGINLFMEVNTFQVTMWIIYELLLCVWFVLTYFVLMDEYYLWHILPTTEYFQGSVEESGNWKVMKMINDYYLEMQIYPIIKSLLMDKFGADITFVVLNYFDCIQFEGDQPVLENSSAGTV